MGYFLLDRLELKTIALLVRGHITIMNEDNNKRAIENLQYQIRQTINKHLNEEVFHKRFIPTLVIPDSVARTNKAFINMEFTFFNKIRDKKLILSELQLLMDKIYDNVIEKSENIEFNKSAPRHRTSCQ